MSEETLDLRRINWAESLPFVRLFHSFKRAISFWPMTLAFAAVFLTYVSGRVFDGIWIATGNGLVVEGDARRGASEIDAFMSGAAGFERWQERHAEPAEDATVRGPFALLLRFEMQCVALAAQGAIGGSWAPGSGPGSVVGALFAAGTGLLWLVTKHPVFTILFGLDLLAIMALFGGAICRAAAVQATRDENLSGGAALRFSWEKWFDFLVAPLMPVVLFILAAVLMVLGGLVGAIPAVGELLAGLGYGLALLGGLALAFAVLALVFGFHLMWPTIAVEGSDSFDGVQRSAGYLFQRFWSVGFYTFVLLLYGALSFIVMRVVVMLLLKLTHVATGIGMSFFGLVHSSGDESLGKLNGMWQMPAWADLPLLPTLSGGNFWGAFNLTGSLGTTEWLAMWLLMFWVFLVVGLLGAFVVSFYFCGSTEMYLLLRREVDGVDYDEIYYEEYDEDEWSTGTDDGSDGSDPEGGTSLPVVDQSS